jgi:hypothetical protein
MVPHRNIHKFIWTSPDGKTHNQISHILIDMQKHLNVFDVQSFRTGDCENSSDGVFYICLHNVTIVG